MKTAQLKNGVLKTPLLSTSLLCTSLMAALAMLQSTPATAMARKLTGPEGAIKIGTDVPSDQAKLMVKDLELLHRLDFALEDADLIRVMKLDSNRSSSLEQWLNDRVQYIVGEDFNLKTHVRISSFRHTYENQGIEPEIETPTKTPDGSSQVKVVMANVGSAIYYGGKSTGVLLGLKVPGYGKIAVTSPRTGIIQVGAGLFRPLLRAGKRVAPENASTVIDSAGNSMSRLGTFFHEARHSDGNGKSLGFFHATCPEEHDYAGYPACDRNLNGPYTVGALVLKTLAENCADCSVAEKEVLKLDALDSFGRILKAKTAPRNIDLDLECLSLFNTRDELIRLKKRTGADIAIPEITEECKELESVHEGKKSLDDLPPRQIRATDWNDAPEGRRQ